MIRAAFAWVLACACATACAANPTLPDALRSLAEGLPRVAVSQLKDLLAGPLTPDARSEALLALARARIAMNDPAAALAVLDDAHLDNASSRYWRGHALAQLGRWSEALTVYEAVAGDSELADDARFGRGEALAALGRDGEAASIFEKLSVHPRFAGQARLRQAAVALRSGRNSEAATLLAQPPSVARPTIQENAERACLAGRLRLAENKPSAAEVIFSAAVSQPVGISERVLVDDYRGWAMACLAQGQIPRAEDVLESFVDRYPRLGAMPAMLRWLETLYASIPPPDDLADLRRWSEDTAEPARQALASVALGVAERNAGRPEKAAAIFAKFGKLFPESPLRARALLELASLRLREGHSAEAREILDDARKLADPESSPQSEIAALDAQLSLAQNDLPVAARHFEALSTRLAAGPLAEAAAFNGVLARSRANDPASFVAAQNAFEARFPASPLTVEFSLEQGLAEAAETTVDDPTGRQRAAARLRSFIRSQPAHPRAAEARIALAELAYMRLRPDLPLAWRQIAGPEIRQIQNDGGAASDRADYLAIWLADAPGPAHDEDKAIALAKAFLERRASVPLAAEARMKLSEIYFRREDYSDAQTQLELLAQKSPSSPLAEQALYLAGLSASRSMSPAGLDKAVALFESTAGRNGPLKLPARLRQAELQTRVDRGRDALILYDGVIAATTADNLSPADTDARCAALAGRGETLFAMAIGDAKLYADSAAAFDQLANLPAASLSWRRQALTKKGRALEKSGDADGALVAYDQTLNAEVHPGEPAEPEWTWFYRAGNDAAKLLEARAEWPAAIAIYKKLAAADGPLKAEFDGLLRRRRLEHFVWEE